MIDHIGFAVSNYAKAKAFYVAALQPLGISLMMEIPVEVTGDFAVSGFGKDGKPFFWISESQKPVGNLHIALLGSRAAVDAFYEAALAAGGKDNGPPGIRAHYHANYYGAFVFDPDGNNIEAVCHAPA